MQVCEGEGWRLVHDPARHPFVVLIGGGSDLSGSWAAELTTGEAEALRRAVVRLVEQHADLAVGLMEEEAIELELEVPCDGGVLWLALVGDRQRWRLRFVLTPGAGLRALEGGWDTASSAAVSAALTALPLGASEPSSPDSAEIAGDWAH